MNEAAPCRASAHPLHGTRSQCSSSQILLGVGRRSVQYTRESPIIYQVLLILGVASQGGTSITGSRQLKGESEGSEVPVNPRHFRSTPLCPAGEPLKDLSTAIPLHSLPLPASMPAIQASSYRTPPPASPPPFDVPKFSIAKSDPTTRQASPSAQEKYIADVLIKYGCLWEDHAHHIRVKGLKTPAGFKGIYDRALARWISDPQYSQWLGPRTYPAGREEWLHWIDGVINTAGKPIDVMTIEEHCLAGFAAWGASIYVSCNEYKPTVEGGIDNVTCSSIVNKTIGPDVELKSIIGASAALVGTTYTYKDPKTQHPRTCTVTGYSSTLPGVEYTVQYDDDTAMSGANDKNQTMSDDDFEQIWDARLEE
ncbi:uncharacterized protein B0H18DRAFT_1101298 [Fomitopsis serialis]|uniref:uncharacterized protein n=1 Tax=Fomitopsis serialis TaxID=139415 RepID=UPI002008490B|nr:uncharacterized protein B0H18DRAFT_1101298 [Neoantrodia serialis]KAH9935589.1 hypothetical protein B0H18DRAFT_1101298 [Neoantrodia serialis]